MYLGANGFWISQHPDKPWLLEVRRRSGDQAGAPSGELYLAPPVTRRLWRHRARAEDPGRLHRPRPRRLDRLSADAGRGRSAHRLAVRGIARRRHRRFRPVNGAADRSGSHRLRARTPPNTLLLACSFGHNENALLVPEEQYFVYSAISGRDNPLVRSDIVYFTTRRGGAVFSASSMAWCGSLAHNGYDNNVARLTGNVLRRFATPGPLEEVVEG